MHVEVRNVGRGLGGLDVAALFAPFRRVAAPPAPPLEAAAAEASSGGTDGVAASDAAAGGAATLTALRSSGLGLPISFLLAVLMHGRVGLYDVYERVQERGGGASGEGEGGGNGVRDGHRDDGREAATGPAPAGAGMAPRSGRRYAYTVFAIQVPLVEPGDSEAAQ